MPVTITITVIIAIIISAALIICAAYILLLKKDIRRLNNSLCVIKKSDTNTRLTTETFDKDICLLCNTINEILDEKIKIVKAAEKSNTEFKRAITNISHDLRTPLTSAIGYLQMLNSEKTLPEKREEYPEIIKKRLNALSELINGLFEYAQIMEGKTEFNTQKVNICNILRDMVSSFYGEFSEKGFEVIADIPDEPVYVLCDGQLFGRTAGNLIRNALEHGYGYFAITLDGNSVSDNVEIIFKNRVKNLDKFNIERMFYRFYTADFSRNRGNAGLGLAIVKELTEGMGGAVESFLENDVLCIRLKFKRF